MSLLVVGGLFLSSCRVDLVAGSMSDDLYCLGTVNSSSAYCDIKRRNDHNHNRSNRRNGKPGRYRGFAFIESNQQSNKVSDRTAAAAEKYDLSDESAEFFVNLLDLMIKNDLKALEQKGIALKDFEKIAAGDKLSDRKLSELVVLLKLDDISHAEYLVAQVSEEIKMITANDKKSSPLTGW